MDKAALATATAMEAEHRLDLRSNSIYFLSIQVAGLVAALVTIPHVISVLGLDGFGRYAWTMSLVAMIALLADFGTGITGARDIAAASNAPARASIVRKVLATKLILTAGLVLAIIGACYMVPMHETNRQLLAVSTLVLVATSLSPLWIFQGVENMRWLAIATAATRTGWVAAVFIFVQTPEHAWLLVVLDGLLAMAVTISGLFLTRRYWHHDSAQWVDAQAILETLKTGWPVLLSQIASYFYTAFAVVLLGIFSNPTQAGIYSFGEKVANAMKRLLGSPLQAYLPAIQRARNNRGWQAKERKLLLLLPMAAALITIAAIPLVLRAQPHLIPQLAAQSSLSTVLLLLTTPLVVSSFASGVITLIGLGQATTVVKAQIVVAILLQPALLLASHIYGSAGAAATVLAAELVLAAALLRLALKAIRS